MSKIKMSLLLSITLIIIIILPITAPRAGDGPKLKFNYSERIRIETSDNVKSFDKAAGAGFSYVRHRTILSLRYFPVKNLEFGVATANEFRYNLVPETGYARDEIFFDQLYLKIDSIAKMPIGVTLGRQNITLGEGFVVMDGGPLDGSRSSYFNAARADWGITPGNNLTLIYLYQPQYDKYLPVIDDMDKVLVEQPEEGFILYHTGKFGKLDLQSYFIRKNMEETTKRPKWTINCPGIRIQFPLIKKLKLTGEGGYQFGKKDTLDQSAFGFYAYGEYTTGWPIHFPKNLVFGTVNLSGQDKSSRKITEWNPLWGRWPKWSDSYIYAQIAEQGVAYWTNLQSIFVKTSLDIVPDLTLSLDYHHMRAFHDNYTGNGLTRGDLIIGRLLYKANDHLSGHFIWEWFRPGDYYRLFVEDYDDPYLTITRCCAADSYGWARFEILIKF